jgi:hypothetical protein|tara:strand:+ start:467 stop:667 length:201 start_codon:yes stop_codon:yes gene_type:complete
MNDLNDIQLPYTVEELINVLDKVFPEKAPDLKDSERTVWHKAGQRSVVTWLLELKNRNDNNLLGEK